MSLDVASLCRRLSWTVLAIVFARLACGCHRAQDSVFVVAPFNDETRIARVTASWQPAGGDGLRFEVRVQNLLSDQLFVRLDGFALTDARGAALASSPIQRACVLGGSADDIVLGGTLALSPEAAARVAGFKLNRFGVPLSERGRGIYREFLLQSEKYTAVEVDAEIGGYQRAEACS